MFKIPTLYTNYQELLLDLDILGKILSESVVNKDELKTLLFEEYKVTHPLPTLEDKRYELSDLVSSDYHISYANEIELAENERLVDLGQEISDDNFEFEGNITVPDLIREKYEYGSVTDRVRESLIEEYYNNETEEFTEEISKVEGVFATVENHASIYEEDTSDEYEDYSDDAEDTSGYDEEEDNDLDDYGDYSDEEDDSEDEEDDSDEEEYPDEDDYGDYSDDSEDDSEDDYGDYSDEEDDSDNEDDFGDYSNEDESDDEDEYGDYSDEDDTSEDEEDDDSDNYLYDKDDEETSDDEYEDYSEDEEDSFEYQVEEDEGYSKTVVGDTDIQFEEPVKVVPTPIDIANKNKKVYSQVVEETNTVVNREDEPKDLREFLRKHPRCEVSFALQYFSRKEIEKYIMMGKVIKKGTKLHI